MPAQLGEGLRKSVGELSIFPNKESCLRLETAMCVEQSEEWVSGRRYPDMEKLRAWWAGQREERELDSA